MSPLDHHIKILQKRYTIEMANRNVDTDVWSAETSTMRLIYQDLWL